MDISYWFKNFLNENFFWLSILISISIFIFLFKKHIIKLKKYINYRYQKKVDASYNILKAFETFSSEIKKIVEKRIFDPIFEKEENLFYQKQEPSSAKVFFTFDKFHGTVLPLIYKFPKKLNRKLKIKIKKTEKIISFFSKNILKTKKKSTPKKDIIEAEKNLSLEEIDKKLNDILQEFKNTLKKYIN